MIGGGIGGFFIAGPVGAFAGGAAGGTGMDALTTHIESKIHGEVMIKRHSFCRVLHNWQELGW